MKSENRAKMAKAIGMLEALSFVVKSPAVDALDLALNMFNEVLADEGDGDGAKADGDRFDF